MMRPLVDGAHPAIIDFMAAFIKRTGQMGIPMFAAEVIRTPERQDQLFEDGHSKAKGGQSAHQYGMAVDLVHAQHGWSLNRDQWKLLGDVGMDIAKTLSLPIGSKAWGGNWKFYDPAHWQVDDWKNQIGEYPWPLITYPELKRSRKQASS